MASSALEEKINKIRQQNEEIRRRYEEVEEDKKNAAKLNALVQMVPSTDWPERKEPPEFSNPPKSKPKVIKEKHEFTPQFHPEGKKIHSFAQGEGPPPDPKYNFLADSEREEPSGDYSKESNASRSHHKATRGSFRKKNIGRGDSNQKDIKPNKGNYRDDSQPGYDAWRAERNRIDEDRISRQRTAEGNWRREWDNDKVHILDDVVKKTSRPTLGDFTKKDHKDSGDRRYHSNNNEHVNYSRGGGQRPPHRGSSKNFYGNFDNRSHNTYDQHRNNTVAAKTPVSPTFEERTVIATEKSLKVTVNQSNQGKGHVMSVKVNSPSIAGTGRVGPRQRTRVTYSHSDADLPPCEGEPFLRQKSFEDKSKGSYFNNQKYPNLRRSHSQKNKEKEVKYHHQKRDSNEFRSFSQKDQQKSQAARSPKPSRVNTKTMKQDSSIANVSQNGENQECSTADPAKPECDMKAGIDQDAATGAKVNTQIIESSENEKPGAREQKQHETEGEILVKEEMKQISVIPASTADNPEHVAKGDTSETSVTNESVCLEAVANDAKADTQESSMSSQVSVPCNESTQELVPNESNVKSDNIIDTEKVPSKEGDKQSSEEDAKQSVNDDCDNAEGLQPSMEESLSEDKTNSVINVNNQLVRNNEKEQQGEESPEKNINDVENNLKEETVNAKSVEKDTEKAEESKNIEQEQSDAKLQ